MSDLNSLFGDLDSISKSHEPQWCTSAVQHNVALELITSAENNLKEIWDDLYGERYTSPALSRIISNRDDRRHFGSIHFVKSVQFSNSDDDNKCCTNIVIVNLLGDVVEEISNTTDIIEYFMRNTPGLLYSFDRRYYYILKADDFHFSREESGYVHTWTIEKRKCESEPYWRFEDLY